MTDWYKILDGVNGPVLTGGSFTGNGNCNDDGEAAWDGIFEGESPCWVAHASAIGGKARTSTGPKIDYTDPNNYTMRIVCCDNETGQIPIWAGSKTGGTSPIGVYDRAEGSGTRDKIEVVDA